MKKVITMVGTSLFNNYMEIKNDTTFKKYVDDLKGKQTNEYDSEKKRIDIIRRCIDDLFRKSSDKTNLSAEIKSLIKLKEELKENLEIHLLTSDTILSNLAAEIIAQIYKDVNELSGCKLYNHRIEDLQIQNRQQFNSGMTNLIYTIYRISNEYWQNIIINITAGYKATLPYLTILAQVNKCPIYYIFEDTDALIKIPYIPLSINWDVFKRNENFLFDLEVSEIQELPREVELKEELESLIERADNLIVLNPLGIVLWERYKNSFYLFKISEISDEYIRRNSDRKSIIEKSFIELHRILKEDPNNPDLDHPLANVNIPSGFKIFKHKENNLHVRILYKKENYKTRYNVSDFRLYIGPIAIGQEVHNVESEYVDLFERNAQKVTEPQSYKIYRIERESMVKR